MRGHPSPVAGSTSATSSERCSVVARQARCSTATTSSSTVQWRWKCSEPTSRRMRRPGTRSCDRCVWAAGLAHPSVVAYYDTDAVDGVPYIVMERLPGRTLVDEISRGPLDAGTIRAIATQVLEGLQAAHAAGVVHRDRSQETSSSLRAATPRSWTSASPRASTTSPPLVWSWGRRRTSRRSGSWSEGDAAERSLLARRRSVRSRDR